MNRKLMIGLFITVIVALALYVGYVTNWKFVKQA